MKSSNFNQKVYDISEHIQRDFFWCIVKDRMPKKVNYSRVPNNGGGGGEGGVGGLDIVIIINNRGGGGSWTGLKK